MTDIAAHVMDTASAALSNASAILAADPTRAVPLGTFLVVLLRWPACLLRAAMVALCSVAFIGRIPAPYHMGVALLLVVPPPKKKAAAVDKRALVNSERHAHHRARLVAFYEAHAPEKANSANIDDVLVKYLGQEPKLFAMLEKKYLGDVGAEPAGDEHLPSPPKKKKAKAPAKAPAPPPGLLSPKEKAKHDARAAMEARVNARLAKKK